MSRLLELINQDVIETIQSHTLFCICCLKRNVDFINITTCSHSDYLYNFTRPELKPINEVICHTCHRILKKIKQFKLQVMQSFNLLTTQALNMETADKVKPSFGFVKVVDINIPSENPNPREADSNAIVPPDKATEPTLAKPVNKKQKKNKKEALNIIDDNASVKLFAAVEMEEAAITEYMETIVVKEEASVMDPLACSGKTATPELPAIVKIEGNPMMEEETQVPEVVIENAVTGVISRIAGTDAVVCSDPGRAKDDMPKLTAGFPCPMCNKGYQTKEAMQDHFNYQHLGKTVHKCPVCDKPMASLQHVERHMIAMHGQKKDKPRNHEKTHICKVCGRSFKYKRALTQHEPIHSGGRSLSCDICQKTFKQRTALYSHRKLIHNVIR
ncbi:unnamed protein product [Chrysodeixis includens]|uniref:C2H2-type domain-containing protein n=1 Tax=Chrysodeixis includens TaxID=689277 RepID=A0A9P0FXX2_CHRIL|nr:unnamed protein product [Chrysodeixis includens]